MMHKDTLVKQLSSAGQLQLAEWISSLDDDNATRLAAQLESLDFEQLAQLRSSKQVDAGGQDRAERAGPPPAIRSNDPNPPFAIGDAIEEGNRLLANGQVAMILVAGGQGTRLGFDRPKGCFPIGPVSERPLFQVIIDHLRARSNRAGRVIPLYVMTSPATHDPTIEFLNQHQHFGLAEEDVRVFCQGTMPAVSAEDGSLLLDAPDSLALSPDGHGGMLKAFFDSGCAEDAALRGVEHIFYAQIDNPLVTVCEPMLLGFHSLSKSEMTTQVVRKQRPLEKVGNVVELDGKVQIIEYSDLPESVALATNEDGSPKLWAGNIAVHVFRNDFLNRVAADSDSLPFHHALKKVPYIDAQGSRIEPSEPNATKFERFIFDLLPHANNAIAVEAEKDAAFAPVKNANEAGVDTPETAKQAISALHRSWLKQAGIVVAEQAVVEISPHFALSAEEVAEKKDRIDPIESDTFLDV